MRNFVKGAAALAALATAIPVAAAPEGDGGDRRECRMVAPTTGSRLGGRRVCRPASEWRAIEQEAQRDFDRSRTAPNIPRAPL